MNVEARTVFCDEIRREDNGKAILIGVYTDDLVPGTMPARFPLSVWIKAKGLDVGNHPFSVKFAFPGVEEKPEVRGEVKVGDSSAPVSLIIAGVPAEVHQAGVIRVELDVNGEILDVGELCVRSPLK